MPFGAVFATMSISTFLKKKWIRAKYGGGIIRRYYGTKGGSILGAVHAPGMPSKRFHVGLLDGEGTVILTVKADKSHHKSPIPAGYGFEIPISALSAGKWPGEKRIQLKVVETGEIFPEQARELPGVEPEKPVEPGVMALRRHMKSLPGLLDPQTIVAGTHETSRTGAPMILLEILRQFSERHGLKMVLLNLGPKGPLQEEFRKYCLAVIDDLKTVFRAAPEEAAELFSMLHEKAYPVAIINSLCATSLVDACRKANFEVVSLVHEYPVGFSTEQIQTHFGAAETIVFPCRDVLRTYEKHPDLAGVFEDSAPSCSILPQGCYMLEKPKLDEAELDRLRQQLRAECGIGTGEKVVLSCGTIDSRKGFDWLVSLVIAFNRQSAHARDTHFVWVGRTNNHDLFRHAKHDLAQAGVMSRFHHIGELSDTRAAFCLADLFLLCSRVDPFPSVVLEAFLHGVPVIAFDHWQGSADMIRDTKFGKVVPYLDTDATISAMEEIFHGTIIRGRVRRMGHTFVEKNFRYAAYVDALAERLLKGETIGLSAGDRYGAPSARELPEAVAPRKGQPAASPGGMPPVMVLGFHYSGTARISRWFHAGGIRMNPTGEFFDQATDDAEEGQFEDLDFLTFHREIMMLVQGGFMTKWGGPLCPFLRNYEIQWRQFRRDAEALAERVHQTSAWGWNDPRTLLFLNLWDELFPDAIRVLALRHPLEVLYAFVSRANNPLVLAHPLAVFDAYVGYHKPALAQFAANPESLLVVRMPPDDAKLALLTQRINERLGVSLHPNACSDAKGRSRFPGVSGKVAGEFGAMFPEVASAHDTLAGLSLSAQGQTAGPLSEDEKLDWVENALVELTDGEFRLYRELHRARRGN